MKTLMIISAVLAFLLAVVALVEKLSKKDYQVIKDALFMMLTGLLFWILLNIIA